VFEYFIGAGATRFTAIYYGQDAEKVGPVRSARLIDASLGLAYNTVFGFASADPFVFSRVVRNLGDRAITLGDATCPALCRTGDGDVNSVFADTALLTQYAVEKREVDPARPNLDGMTFDVNPPVGGVAGDWIQAAFSPFSISEWRYDAGAQAYLRWIEEVDAAGNVSMVELTDRETSEQLAFKNVVVVFVQYNELKPTLHEVVLLGNVTGLRALLFRDGQMYDILWKSIEANQPLQFFTQEGEHIPFSPGNTWFEVVGLSSTVDETEPGHWQVNFLLP